MNQQTGSEIGAMLSTSTTKSASADESPESPEETEAPRAGRRVGPLGQRT